MLSGPVREVSDAVGDLAATPVPCRGLGEATTAAADAAQLAHLTTVLTGILATRIPSLEADSALPYGTVTSLLQAGWAPGEARNLRRAALFADAHPAVAAAWTAGQVTTHQIAALSRAATRLEPDQVPVLIDTLLPVLPGLTAAHTGRLLDEAVDLIRPTDPDLAETSDHRDRYLAWTRPGGRDGLHVKADLPAAEADAFLAAITATGEALRAIGDGVTVPQRRADALTALITAAAPAVRRDREPVAGPSDVASADPEPTATGRPAVGGGLPVALTLTVSLTEAARLASRDPAERAALAPDRRGDDRPACHSGHGFRLRDAAARFGLCCAAVTPVLQDSTTAPAPDGHPFQPGSLAARLAATRTIPLALGRAVRLATPAQRTALALRDGGCVIPGCDIDVGHTQPHHVTPWAIGGRTDLDALALLCWVHHRQVELGRFTLTHIDQLPHGTDPDRPPPGTRRRSTWWITPHLR